MKIQLLLSLIALGFTLGEPIPKQALSQRQADDNSSGPKLCETWAEQMKDLQAQKALSWTVQTDTAKHHWDGSVNKEKESSNGHYRVVTLLLVEGGFDLNAKDVFGETPLSLAAKDDHGQGVRILLKQRDINQVIEDENKILELAVQNGHVNVVQLLLQDKGVINAYQIGEKAVRLAWATADTTPAILEVVYNSAL
ncbi:hypothetical protein BDV35DRAFT_392492 [Aspergillus flavus]|uniref:Uncharacterized protein n=1 Tax=Aspergillus flavus TaxID=5059 RepID=A0A5N6H0G8_ASPFL|nr:hypothetical protein BDV35DRAFT_392492 [Aspergillus flavus]